MFKNKLKIFTGALIITALITTGILMPFSQAKAEEKGFTDYTGDALKYSIVIAALLAVIMIIIGGFQYIMAAGNTSAIESAKNRIWQAILGLLLVIGSYLILHTINPDLVHMNLGITPIEIPKTPETETEKKPGEDYTSYYCYSTIGVTCPKGEGWSTVSNDKCADCTFGICCQFIIEY